MNDLSLPTVQEFFTAGELAKMAARWGYKKLPHTESGVIRRAKRDGWNDQPMSLCRQRKGVKGGGGLEYHISMLPDMQGMLLKERLLLGAQFFLEKYIVSYLYNSCGTQRKIHRNSSSIYY